MSAKQHEALRLADLFETFGTNELAGKSAAELRRLHAENEALRAERDKAKSENQRWIQLATTCVQEVKTEQRLSFRTQMQQCAAQRDALLEALKKIKTHGDGYSFEVASAAIAKATGEQA